MRCEQFEQRIQGLLDRRAIPQRDSVLLAHASRCVRCRRLLHCESEVADFFLGDDEAPVPSGLTRTVMADLGLVATCTRRAWFRDRRWQLVGVAAVVLVCVLPALLPGLPGRTSPERLPGIAHSTESTASAEVGDATVSPGPMVDGQATRQLVTLASQRLERADEVAITVAGDLSPWARSIGAAFAALTGGWPAPQRETPAGRTAAESD